MSRPKYESHEPVGRIAVYDNGGKTADRYTVVYLDRPGHDKRVLECLGMSDRPFHPQGFGQHDCCIRGRYLGKRILFSDLPPDCQKAALQG
jgi:hypothetical protein